MFGFMPATNNGVAAYQRALRALRENHRDEFNEVLKSRNESYEQDLARAKGYGWRTPSTPYNQALSVLRDERYRDEFEELKTQFRSELDGEVDAAIESIRRDAAKPAPPPATDSLAHVGLDDAAVEPVGEPTYPMSLMLNEVSIPMSHYSMALDEIYLLRAALADEARILDGHLNFQAFPLSRRKMAAEQVERMRGMAAGMFEEWARPDFDPKEALASAGIDKCMTRAQWEQQRKLTG